MNHRDSLGSSAGISPGELNLMTAGAGISHSEYSAGSDDLHGVQLWVALPDSDRGQPPHFEHHPTLPRLDLDHLSVTVVMGELAGARSPARLYTPLVCAEVRLAAGASTLPLEATFEHGLLLLDGDLEVDEVEVPRSALTYLPERTPSATLRSRGGAIVLLVGGAPLAEELLMWWNFVARTQDEIVQARQDWAEGGRFGTVVGDPHPALPAPELPRVRLRPRPGRRS